MIHTRISLFLVEYYTIKTNIIIIYYQTLQYKNYVTKNINIQQFK